jgi:cytochrome c
MRIVFRKTVIFMPLVLFVLSGIAGLVGAAHAQGSVRHGQAIYKDQCMACHALDRNKIGPAHRGVFGRIAGTAPGYDYSPAFRKSRLVWNEKTLNQWLFNPEKLIPGQRMDYYLEQQQDRDDVIAFLKSLGPAKPPPCHQQVP